MTAMSAISVWDHPRGCGEHDHYGSTEPVTEGSSPRMRGARLAFLPLLGAFGIIPADAGSTRQGPARGSGWRDHPRGCGEHPGRWLLYLSWWGSSPRMRGARRFRVSACKKGDHPRGCGEHVRSQPPRTPGRGSSPRMRGARGCFSRSAKPSRIIPADAGSTGSVCCYDA